MPDAYKTKRNKELSIGPTLPTLFLGVSGALWTYYLYSLFLEIFMISD